MPDPYVYDPSQLSEPVPPFVANPLDAFADVELTEVAHNLFLACGRSKFSLRKNQRKYFCALWRLLEIERRRRGLPPVL